MPPRPARSSSPGREGRRRWLGGPRDAPQVHPEQARSGPAGRQLREIRRKSHPQTNPVRPQRQGVSRLLNKSGYNSGKNSGFSVLRPQSGTNSFGKIRNSKLLLENRHRKRNSESIPRNSVCRSAGAPLRHRTRSLRRGRSRRARRRRAPSCVLRRRGAGSFPPGWPGRARSGNKRRDTDLPSSSPAPCASDIA